VEERLYVLFGKHEDDHGNPICPPMQVFDTRTLVLTSPSFEPGSDGRTNVPVDREGHTASVVGSCVYVFGGTWTDEEESTIYLNDLHCLDTTSLSWSRPAAACSAPIEREGHTAATIGSRIFIFGGTWVDDEDNSIYLNDLYALQTEGHPTWSQPASSGEPPIPREGHTASVVGTQMVVFGGAGLDADERSINLHDLHVLSTESMVWSQPKCSGRPPQERRYHSASVVGDEMLIFGGQYYDLSADLHFECDNALCVYDLKKHAWSSVAVDATTPLRRACHAAGVVSKRVYLIGGRYWDVAEDDYIFLNDIQILHTRAVSTLATDWAAFINNEHLSDISIVVGGQTVFAHRIVLAARCAYFRAMFGSGMREASSTTITLDDIDYAVFLALLEHLYTDSDHVPPDLALRLFAAADFLGVEHLKQVCAAHIESGLTIHNVCRALTAADAHDATALKETCVAYIVQHFQEVIPTDGFKELPRPLLDLVHRGIAPLLARHSSGNAPNASSTPVRTAGAST